MSSDTRGAGEVPPLPTPRLNRSAEDPRPGTVSGQCVAHSAHRHVLHGGTGIQHVLACWLDKQNVRWLDAFGGLVAESVATSLDYQAIRPSFGRLPPPAAATRPGASSCPSGGWHTLSLR